MLLPNSCIFLLILLAFKHYLFDFVFQTSDHIRYKGVYGDTRGVDHSLQHAWGTVAILTVVDLSFFHVAAIIGILEAILHYHIDYVKMKFFQYSIDDRRYWITFGFDQYLHYLTYITIVYFYGTVNYR